MIQLHFILMEKRNKMNTFKFIHHIPKNGKGGSTIAYKIEKTNTGKRLVFSVGFCSHKDTYCKQKGRDAAIKQWTNDNKLTLIIKNIKNAEKNMHYLSRDFTSVFDNKISFF